MIACRASSLCNTLTFLQQNCKYNHRILGGGRIDLGRPPRLKNTRVFCSNPSEEKKQNSGNNKNIVTKQVEQVQESGQVHCEVDVISWRERRISASILVLADVQSVWNVLTDYERLADFIPNLVSSGRIDCPYPGRIWVEQRGLQQALYWQIEARVVLDLQELPNLENGRELRFSMVDGDFKKFEGKWSLKSGVRSSTTIVSYEVNVIPRLNIPAIVLERIIRSDLPINLQALACRAERNYGMNSWSPSTSGFLEETSKAFLISEMNLSDKFSVENTNANVSNLHSSGLTLLNSKWGIFGSTCRLDKRCMADEVHLRRFDGILDNGGVHRCVVASITIKAPVREVWNTLTFYEKLPEIVPNLAISKILSRDSNKVRILQEGCKGVLYMVLHARVVLDLYEQHEREIRFEQVEGDFDSFRGKWILEQLGNHHTLLKYDVESKMHKDSFLLEAFVEEVIYEDLPSNLCAIRDYVEKKETESNSSDESYVDESIIITEGCTYTVPLEKTPRVSKIEISDSRKKPKVPGLQRDIEILKSELLAFVSEHGQEGFMPMRKQLRLHGRVDIEKAINRMGGFRKIACLMNLSLAYKHRKAKGYWDNLENLEEEIKRFQRNWGMDSSYMPSRKSFQQAGRYDIARALEKWGGLHEVARLLSLKVRHPNRHPNHSKENKGDNFVDQEKTSPATGTPFVEQHTQKWHMNLKHLDLNWVD